MYDDEEPVPKLSYKFTSKDCKEVLKKITGKENKLEYVPLTTISNEKFKRQ